MAVTEFERDGRIFIDGTSGDDVIQVFPDGHGHFKVSVWNRYGETGAAGDQLLFEKTYPNEYADRLVVRGGAGHDNILLSASTELSGLEIHGGIGNDTVLGSAPGSQRIFGDEGADLITTSGNDTVDGGSGPDEIWGTAGRLRPTVEQQNISGGNDTDRDVLVVGFNDSVELHPGDVVRLDIEGNTFANLKKLLVGTENIDILNQVANYLDHPLDWVPEKAWNALPESFKDRIVTTVWKLKNSPIDLSIDERAKLVGEVFLALIGVGDVIDLGVQGFNFLTGEEVDSVVILFAGLGLAGDLGWLDGLLPDPLDGLNVASAAFKALYKQMGEPAQRVMKEIAELATKNVDGLKRLGESLIELAQRFGLKGDNFTRLLADYVDDIPNLLKVGMDEGPDVMRRVMSQGDAALHNALKNPQVLREAVDRAKFADELIGKSLSDLTPSQRARFDEFYKAFQRDGKTIIQRRSVDQGYAPLRFDQDGKIIEALDNVSDRLSVPSTMRANYRNSLGAIPDGHQIHHLIPDSVVRDHELAVLARQVGYDLDDASNLLALPFKGEAFDQAQVPIIHLGSHPQWNRHATQVLDEKLNDLRTSGVELSPQVLRDAMQEVQQTLRTDILDTSQPWIKKIIIDGREFDKLTQNNERNDTVVVAAAQDLNTPQLIDATGRGDAARLEARLQQLDAQYENGERALAPAVTLLSQYGESTELGMSLELDDLTIASNSQEGSLSMARNGATVLTANAQEGLTFSQMDVETANQLDQLAQQQPEAVQDASDLAIA